MPATFTAVRGAFTPSTSNDNWTAQANANCLGKVVRIGWGGRMQQSTSYRTRWGYPNAVPTGAATSMTIQVSNPAVTSVCTIASTYATTQPTLQADPQNLFALDWNAQGGEGVLNFTSKNGWIFSAGASLTTNSYISCRNTVGTDVNGSNYWVIWEE